VKKRLGEVIFCGHADYSGVGARLTFLMGLVALVEIDFFTGGGSAAPKTADIFVPARASSSEFTSAL
jgi:hypothetical protein